MSATINLGRVVGYSAYEVAVKNGFEGTEQEWLTSLQCESPFKGWFGSSSALSTSYPNPQIGDYAYVVDGGGNSATIYAESSGGWVDTQISVSVTDMESIFSTAAKNALVYLLERVAYTDANGQSYINTLKNLLTTPVSSVSAVFVPGDEVFFTTDSLDKLRPYLVVTATYANGTTSVVDLYTLSGTLTSGTSTITVTLEDKTTTFTVNVIELSGYTIYDYITPKQEYATSGTIARNIRLKQYANLNVLSCEFKFKLVSGHKDGATIFGARTSGTTTHTNSYAFYAHTGALGYHLHGTEATTGLRPPLVEGDYINVVKYTNTSSSPSSILTNGQNTQSVVWDNNNTLNLKPSLFYNTIDDTNGPIQNPVKINCIKFYDLSGTKISHYVVVKRDSDNVVGMYDVVENAFYTASTTNYAKIGNSNCIYEVGNW